MIGLYAHWSGEEADLAAGARFVAALGIVPGSVMGSVRELGAVMASAQPSAAAARAWRPARIADKHVLFAGHLSNHDEIARLLGVRGDAAALYAAAYARWGDDADLRLIGEFATIVVDMTDRTVRAARSPILAPPLHVWHDDTRVLVASTARALFATGAVRQEIDEQKIADTLYLNYAEAERGWFRNVRRLATGSTMRITPRKSTQTRYHDVANLPDIRFKRDADYVEATHAALCDATRAALDGFAAPAVSLSGGLDSQAVAAYAATARDGAPLLGLTAVPLDEWQDTLPPSWNGDESGHAAALRSIYPALDVETVDARGAGLDDKLDALFAFGGVAPRNAMNLYWIHALHARARARGCDVVLTGALGNVSFSFDGSGALPGWLARGAWGRLAREISVVRDAQSFARTLFGRAMMPHLPDPLHRAIRARRGMPRPAPADSWCPLRAEYRRDMQVEQRARDLGYDADYRAPRSTRAWRTDMLTNSLNESGDLLQGMAAIHGIATRDPTAYRPLVELCLGMPDDQYLRDGAPRWLAKRLLRGRIPDSVLDDRRRGAQAADWSLRLWPQRAALRVELERLQHDPAMDARFDLPRLIDAVDRWTHPDPAAADLQTLRLALPRAIATARFIRHVSGTNAP